MAGSVATMTAALGLILLLALKRHLSDSGKNSWLHGSARWAEKKDIVAAGLLPPRRSLFEVLRRRQNDASSRSTGVYVGAWVDKGVREELLRQCR